MWNLGAVKFSAIEQGELDIEMYFLSRLNCISLPLIHVPPKIHLFNTRIPKHAYRRASFLTKK